MIEFEIDKQNLIVIVRPQSALQEEDFEKLTKAVDELIESENKIAGLIIETKSFPGWKSMGAMVKHFKFVRDHHRKINKVALVTDTKIASIAENIVSHFVAADIKRFPAGHLVEARNYVLKHGED